MHTAKNNIVLIGMMGTGKSTVGALLAAEAGLRLVDLDQMIITETGLSIPEIFAQKGETFFRDTESRLLDQVLADEGFVLATGGGVVLREQNCRAMLKNGIVVALKASADDIIARVGEDENRPLLAGGAKERVAALLEERKNAYDFAHHTVDTTGKNAEQVKLEILTRCRG
ncbi:shikimate kinase [Paenibacillus macerans]|uniref:shikimate kinase n=1 Tax=Paenibacillus macerans TaxID=44252 RepID=UPI00203CAF09|nr:shikimate kinase [Paenibacillus macerans]MCM3698424.1 shikimate kinase [Paenibacillus macerans]